jgi:hypothetical protein
MYLSLVLENRKCGVCQRRRFNMEQIKPEEVVEILRDYGTIVTIEEARIILEFMWKLANLTLDQYLSL